MLNGEKRGHFRNNNQTRHRSSPDSPILAMKMFVEWKNFPILRKQTSKKQVLSFSGPDQKKWSKKKLIFNLPVDQVRRPYLLTAFLGVHLQSK